MERRDTFERTQIPRNDIDTRYDIGVDAKFEQVVMIYANAAGRRIVEDLWPEVQWSTDAKFALDMPPDWRFTHIRVTKLSSLFETQVPLSQANPESLGMVVAYTLQYYARPRPVFHWTDANILIG